MRVILTRAALADLVSIRTYIGRRNPAAARRVAADLIAACDGLAFMPDRGRPGLEAGTRELTTVWPYIIVYTVGARTVQIVRIWHGAQSRT